MKNSYLKAAMILGTILMAWFILSFNIFGIIGYIFSWAAYSSGTKKSAFTAMGFYIASSVLYFAIYREILSLASGSTMEPFFRAASMSAAIGIIPTALCALLSYKGGKKIDKNDSGNDGFFE